MRVANFNGASYKEKRGDSIRGETSDAGDFLLGYRGNCFVMTCTDVPCNARGEEEISPFVLSLSRSRRWPNGQERIHFVTIFLFLKNLLASIHSFFRG